jgi:hypothetical protein
MEATEINNSSGANPRLILQGTEASYVRGDLSTWQVRQLLDEEKRPDSNLRGNSAISVQVNSTASPGSPEKPRIDWSETSIDSELRLSYLTQLARGEGASAGFLQALFIRILSRNDEGLLIWSDELDEVLNQSTLGNFRDAPLQSQLPRRPSEFKIDSPADLLSVSSLPEGSTVKLSSLQQSFFRKLLLVESPPFASILLRAPKIEAARRRIKLLRIASNVLESAALRSRNKKEETLFRMILLDYRLICNRQAGLVGIDIGDPLRQLQEIEKGYRNVIKSGLFLMDGQFGLIRTLWFSYQGGAHQIELDKLMSLFSLSQEEIDSLQPNSFQR